MDLDVNSRPNIGYIISYDKTVSDILLYKMDYWESIRTGLFFVQRIMLVLSGEMYNLYETAVFCSIDLWAVCQAQAFTPFNSWQDFDNLNSKTATLPVRCFVQDATGMMWLGTARGLYSYDGYDVRHYISEELPSHQIIKCCLIFQETLFLGGENGILLFNLQTGKFSKPDVEFNETVSAFFFIKGKCG